MNDLPRVTPKVEFTGCVIKESDFLGWLNTRYVRVLKYMEYGQVLVVLLYWLNKSECNKNPCSPRGVYDITNSTVELQPNNYEDLRFLPITLKGANEISHERKCLWSYTNTNLAFHLSFLNEDIGELFCKVVNDCCAVEQEKLLHKYKVLDELGKGAFSTVYRAKRKGSKEFVALKIVSLARFKGNEKELQLSYLQGEIDIMKRLASLPTYNPNVVMLIESAFEIQRPTVFIAMEYCEGGELFDRIVKERCFSQQDAARAVKQIVSALRFLHKNKVVHRDLKPENLVYADNSRNSALKLTDFGLALDMTKHDVFSKNVVGTAGYYAPEVLSLKYGKSRVIMYKMCNLLLKRTCM